MYGCFSGDSRVLAVGDTDGAVRLVRPESGTTFARLEAPEQARLLPFSFTPDGGRLIALNQDTRVLHVWDLRAVRQGLAELGLQGELPAFPAAANAGWVPLRVTVDAKGK
jgi:hypothetical protein